MPRLKKRIRSDDYYVHHCFRNNHLLVRVTYQVSSEGTQQLLDAGLRDGDHIPNELFVSLIGSGDLYTGQSGAPEEFDLVEPLPHSTVTGPPGPTVPVQTVPSAQEARRERLPI